VFVLKDRYSIPDYVVVTAHRGFSAEHPENTIPAFLAAVELGVDILEFDIRGTKDDVPIVLHDATLNRTADRPGSPRDYLLSEIKTFEASYWQGAHYDGVKLSEPVLPGTRIPTFEELLASVGDTVGLNIQVYDTSPPILAEVCRLYRVYDLNSRGYLTVSTFAEAARVRRLDGEIEHAYSGTATQSTESCRRPTLICRWFAAIRGSYLTISQGRNADNADPCTEGYYCYSNRYPLRKQLRDRPATF
jgi:glycerophosphoryl diester phosphodiesterase